jgi:hypothetical protein
MIYLNSFETSAALPSAVKDQSVLLLSPNKGQTIPVPYGVLHLVFRTCEEAGQVALMEI